MGRFLRALGGQFNDAHKKVNDYAKRRISRSDFDAQCFPKIDVILRNAGVDAASSRKILCKENGRMSSVYNLDLETFSLDDAGSEAPWWAICCGHVLCTLLNVDEKRFREKCPIGNLADAEHLTGLLRKVFPDWTPPGCI